MNTNTPAGCGPSRPVRVRQLRDDVWSDLDDVVTPEVSIEVDWKLEGGEAASGRSRLWGWPENHEPLVLGHVLLDVTHPGTVRGLCHSGRVEQVGPGRYSVTAFPVEAPVGSEPAPMRGADLFQAMAAFMAEPGLWNGTGCYHRAGLFDPRTGSLLHRTEDIGRHNCIDRMAGFCALNGVDPSGYLLLLSARVTASMYMKIRRLGVSFLMGQSAVTGAALDMAQADEATLIGFARVGERRFTVFTDLRGRVLP